MPPSANRLDPTLFVLENQKKTNKKRKKKKPKTIQCLPAPTGRKTKNSMPLSADRLALTLFVFLSPRIPTQRGEGGVVNPPFSLDTLPKGGEG